MHPTSLLVLSGQGEKENIHSFIHSICADFVQYCAGYWGPRDEGETQSLLSRNPQGSSKISESWNLTTEETLEIITLAILYVFVSQTFLRN